MSKPMPHPALPSWLTDGPADSMSAAPTMLFTSEAPRKRNEQQPSLRIGLVAGENTRDHLVALLTVISETGYHALSVAHIDPREVFSQTLYDPLTKSKRFDMLLVALSTARDVEALLNELGAPIDTVVVALTSDQSLTEEEVVGDYGCQGLMHSPVSLMALRHTLHKLMPRSTTCSHPLQSTRDGRPTARVLQVEPCAVTANAMQLMFSELGLWMDTAADGAEAMRLLERRPYDLLITELNLPGATHGGMSGCALASWYKTTCARAGRRCAAPTVVITAEPLVPHYEAFGIDYWLERPLSTEYIAQLLHEWLERPRSPPGGGGGTAADEERSSNAASEERSSNAASEERSSDAASSPATVRSSPDSPTTAADASATGHS